MLATIFSAYLRDDEVATPRVSTGRVHGTAGTRVLASPGATTHILGEYRVLLLLVTSIGAMHATRYVGLPH